MAHFSRKDIDTMDYLYRINLINSCSGYKSANLIGTKSNENVPNVAIFSSITHLGSNPAILSFVLRPTTVLRNTYENIKETRKFTINHISKSVIEDAHHTSAKYDKYVSEFDVTDLEEDYKDNFFAPFVKNAPVQIGLSFLEEHHIKANGTILVLGQIEALYIDDTLLQKDGFVDLSKGEIATINGLDGYAVPELYKRLEYQRPRDIYFLDDDES